MTKKYPSKVSYLLLAFVFLVFFGPLIPLFLNDEVDERIIWAVIFLIAVFAFILPMFINTFYLIDKRQLKIKCGFFSYQPIEIMQVTEVCKTNNIISSPAPSFDRIEIKYGKFDSIIISPKDKVNFTRDLISINPKIKNDIL